MKQKKKPCRRRKGSGVEGNGVVRRIRNGQWARGALRDTIFEMAHVFEQMPDPYLAARAENVRNIGRQDLQCNRPA